MRVDPTKTRRFLRTRIPDPAWLAELEAAGGPALVAAVTRPGRPLTAYIIAEAVAYYRALRKRHIQHFAIEAAVRRFADGSEKLERRIRAECRNPSGRTSKIIRQKCAGFGFTDDPDRSNLHPRQTQT